MERRWDVALTFISSIVGRTYNEIADSISNSIGGAIGRVDTLNNANVVFESMGYSAENAWLVSKASKFLVGEKAAMMRESLSTWGWSGKKD